MKKAKPAYYLVAMLLLAAETMVGARGTTRNLSNSTTEITGLSAVGQGCNKRNPCADGLTCSRAPSLLGTLVPRRVCLPLDCITSAVKEFNQKVNITAYQEQTFAKAGVTPDEFFMRVSSRDVQRPKTAMGIGKAMESSPKVRRVMQTIQENPIPWEQWKAYEDSLAACDPQMALSKRTSVLTKGPTTPGIFGTAGFGGDVGAVLGGTVEFFWAYPSANPSFFVSTGGGLLFGIDAGVTGLLGMVFTGAEEDIPGVGFELELEVPTPVIGPGIAVGVDLSSVWDLSFALNLGVGLSVGGFTAGYTWALN